MATATQRGQIIALVNVIFDAAPGGYLNELVGAFDAGASLTALANAMANTSVARSAEYYPTFLTNGEFATKLVDNLAEATPLAAADRTLAIDYITGLLNGGQTRGQVFLAVSTFLSNPATLGDPQFGALAKQFQNEVAVATYYTVDKGGSSLDVGTLRSVLNGVTDSDASVAAAKLAIDNGSFGDGKVFDLTTAQDVFVGGGAADIFNGFIGEDNNGVNDITTLNSQDRLDGGGGFDTLNITVNEDFSITPEVKNIEKISIRVLDSSTASLDFSNVTGVQILEMRDQPTDSYGRVDIDNAQEWIPTLSFKEVAHQTTASMTITYDVGVGTGTDDALTVLLDNAGSDSDGDGFGDEWVFLYGPYTFSGDSAVEHLTIDSKGSRGFNVFSISDASNLVDVTVTGSAGMELFLDDVGALESVDATALGGRLAVEMDARDNDIMVDTAGGDDWVRITNNAGKGKHTINTGGGNDEVEVQDGGSTINTGDGNDKVTVGTGKDTVDLGAGNDQVIVGANLAAGDTFLGGEGRDTISVDSATANAGIPIDPVTKAALATVKGFEILGVTNTLAHDLDLKNWTNADNTVDSVLLAAGFGTFKIDSLGANSTVETRAASVGAVLTANLKDASGTSDVINLITKANANLDFGKIVTPGVETVNITFDDTVATSASKNTATLAVDAVAATTVNVAGDYNAAVLTLTDLSLVTTVNAGTFAGGLTVDLSANAKSLTVTGGAGADVLTFGAKGGNTITSGAGNDTVTIGAGTGNTIDLGAGNDTLNLGNTTNNSITLGAGTDTVNATGVPTNGQSYSTIADFAAKDVIDLSGVVDVTVFGAQTKLAATAVFQDYLDAVVASGAAGASGWFQWNGDTYIVADVGADSATFTNAEDFVLKLTGAIDLSKATVDLVADSITGG